jgi:hypothetical protein
VVGRRRRRGRGREGEREREQRAHLHNFSAGVSYQTLLFGMDY